MRRCWTAFLDRYSIISRMSFKKLYCVLCLNEMMLGSIFRSFLKHVSIISQSFKELYCVLCLDEKMHVGEHCSIISQAILDHFSSMFQSFLKHVSIISQSFLNHLSNCTVCFVMMRRCCAAFLDR
jgi:hypothetical protein